MGAAFESAREALTLPTGGGAIRGIGETFQPDPFTGSGKFVVPLWTSPGREGFGPQLALQYSAGLGNGPFGLGWRLSVPRISRKTEKGLPRYEDDDVFVLSGTDDLVPRLRPGTLATDETPRGDYTVRRYRPRTEGLFARIERWHHVTTDEIHWRITTRGNVTSVYGRSAHARIADPKAESERAAGLTRRSRVFEWLLEETFDAKGNHILYEYAADAQDLRLEGPEAERRTYCQRYLRRICYGNVNVSATYTDGTPVGVARAMPSHGDPPVPVHRRYAFEVVFDYGGDSGQSRPGLASPEWFGSSSPPVREDAFSSHRAGFEVRTLRRCERVLVFHHFAELAEPTLVRSTDLTYQTDSQTRMSLLTAVTTRGYRRDTTGVRTAELPPVTFRYGEFRPHQQRYQPLRAVGDDLPPVSLADPRYALVDLFGDGLPDVLEAGPDGFRYWKNLGDGVLDRPRFLPTVPSGLAFGQPGVGLADMDGDGRLELVVHAGSLQGFYRATPDGAWETFKPYPALPSFDPSDRNVRLVDLTGDGRSDALMTRDHHFLWFECLGEEGFAAPRPVERVHDLDAFPDVHFDDPSRRLHLADMDGDGLADIVLLHEARVDYWPNLGYGRFGPRLTMRAIPDPPQLDPGFDPKRLFIADLNGTGCADLVYVDFDRVHFWLNRSGNSWSPRHTIHGTPTVDDAGRITFADVFGTGVATLLWSSDFAFQPQGNYKALDFAGGVKPFLLQEMDNHMGATTVVRYAPSTRFAARDAQAGQPWVTRLPFPVQVVETVETVDHVARTKLVSSYAYSHGYYDGHEREFRGFARVDVTDTEDFDTFRDPGLHGPPVQFTNREPAHHAAPSVRRTWFHTGASLEDPAVRSRLRREFWSGDPVAFDVDPIMPSASDGARALRGRPIRVEVFGRDGASGESVPFSVTEQAYDVRLVQPPTTTVPPVHFAFCRDALVYQYERDPADPRVTHELTLRIDDLGNTTDAVSVAYPRRHPPATMPEQATRHVLYTKTDYVNHAADTGFYYAGIPCQGRTFEVRGIDPAHATGVLRPADLGAVVDDLSVPFTLGSFRPFEAGPADPTGGPTKRLLAWNRRYFRRDGAALALDIDPAGTPRRTLADRLPLGQIEALGLPYENYDAALTTSLAEQVFGAGPSGPLLARSAVPGLLGDGGYHQEPDVADVWWVPSGQHRFDPAQFCRPVRTRDPHGAESTIVLDRYALLAEEVRDAVGNVVAARTLDAAGGVQSANDYRVLAPRAVMDANGTIAEVLFDALGRVVARAVRKDAEGDTLDDVDPDPAPAEVDAYLADPTTHGARLLGSATTRVLFRPEYRGDLQPLDPPMVVTIGRDRHVSDSGALLVPLHHRFEYFDGFGRGIQKKFVVEGGPIVSGGPSHALRWVGTGWTIFDNKARPVRKYEPFFSETHRFEHDRVTGVSAILLYDPLGRVVATVYPNHTYEKTVIGAWARELWDANDTVDPSHRFDPADPGAVPAAGVHPRQDPDVGPLFDRLPAAAFPDTWYAARTDPARLLATWPDVDASGRAIEENAHVRAAEEAAARATARHAATPTVTHLDALGRAFLTIADAGTADDGIARLLPVRTSLDARGAVRTVTDQRGVVAFTHIYDLLGRTLATDSRDAGLRRSLPDVHGEPMLAWDAAGTAILHRYDVARRLIEVWTRPATALSYDLRERTVYGEAHPGDPRVTNHRGRVWRTFDGGGVLEHVRFDFKGNPLETVRTLLADGQSQVTWATSPDPGTHAFDTTRAEALLAVEHTYRMRSAYDALNRVVRHETPDGSAQKFTYNTANLLAALSVSAPGSSLARPVIRAVQYNALGQRMRVEYGNDVTTEYTYAPETSRLRRLCTTRHGGAPARLQDLHYTYDPVGNVTHVRDDAHRAVFAANRQVDPICRYTYDAAYRLTAATGREHQAMTACHHERHDDRHTVFCQLPQAAANAQALGDYAETYRYDAAGNLEEVRHRVNGLVRWVRTQRYAGNSNRLESSDAGCADEHLAMTHDANGNLTALPHLPGLRWDFKGRLVGADLNRSASPNRAHYQYDASGGRVRKTVVKNGGLLIEERIYLGLFELLLRRTSTRATGRQHAIHVLDDRCRVALLLDEVDPSAPTRVTESQLRYQLGDHLGSAHLEVADGSDARILSYEEHRPYGGSAYLAGEHEGDARRKQHRYTGKECDEESGLYYFGARYYAPWLARWLSPDPAGPRDGTNLFRAFRANPIVYVDRDGRQADDEIDQIRRGMGQAEKAREAMQQITKAEEAAQAAIEAARTVAEEAEGARSALEDQLFHPEPVGEAELERMAREQQETIAGLRKARDEAMSRSEQELERAAKLVRDLPEPDPDVSRMLAEQSKRVGQNLADALDREKRAQRQAGEANRLLSERKPKDGKGPGGSSGGGSAGGGAGSGSGPHGGPGAPSVTSAKGRLGEFGKAMAELALKKGGKLVPIVGTGIGVAAAGAELSEGNYARAFVEIAGASEIPIVAQVADVGGLTADAGWIVKDYLLDPNGTWEKWYYDHVDQ